MKTQVGIIGAGPAGLLLARLLHNKGINSIVIEKESEAYVRNRSRAGILEQTSVDLILSSGAGENLKENGLTHEGIFFHYNGEKNFINFIESNDGKTVTAYTQKQLVNDFIDKAQEDGLKIIFEAKAKKIDGLETTMPILTYEKDSVIESIECDFIVGCDGYHGISRVSIPNHEEETIEKLFPYSLYGVLSDSSPISENIICGYHPNGCSIQSMRGAHLTKFYFQCPNGTTTDSWSDNEIWDELDLRLGVKNTRGKILDKNVIPLRSMVCNKLQHNRLFIAGDSAHIVPPTGAKGMNCAIADISVLSEGLINHFVNNNDEVLDNYTQIALKRIWKVVRFSWWMTTTLFIDPEQDQFESEMQLATLDYLLNSEVAIKSFSENYAGLPIEY